jgi:hypothetical protein
MLVVCLWSCKKEEFTVDCLPANLQNGVIAFYPFNDGSLNDESPNSNNLINTTSAVQSSDRNGNLNCAYVFENHLGQSEFLTSTNSNFLNNLATFSISVWYEALDTSIQGVYLEVLVGRGFEPGHCPDRIGEWSVGIFDGRIPVFGHNNSVWAGTNSPPNINFWHHVVAIKTIDSIKIYQNGILRAQDIGIGNCLPPFQLAQDKGDLFIGNRFTGKIDDVLIYNRELTSQEIDELYHLASCCK